MRPGSLIVVFEVHGQRFGLPLSVVERVLPALAVTPLPEAPDVVAGIVDVQGVLFPVIDMRKRFGLPERPIGLSDHLLLTHTARRRLSLIVDAVSHVEAVRANAWTDAETLVPGTRYLAGVMNAGSGMTLIHDLDTCLSLDEGARLERALAGGSSFA